MSPRTIRRQQQAERFARFRESYARTGNAFRAALEAGYSLRMAKSKSYQLARLVRAARQLDRLGDPAVV